MGREVWKPVVGYEGAYEVSSLGSVRSLPRIAYRGQTALRIAGRVLKPCTNGKGYFVFTLSKEGKTRTFDAHRLVAEAFIGPIPVGQHTRHRNGIKTDCSLGNLVYGTPVENQADRFLHGTDGRGERNPQAKLCSSAVLEIRSKVRLGVPTKDIARAFGISLGHVQQVRTGKRWGHI